MTLTDFKGPTRFNHVAMSMAADDLDEANRTAIAEFYGTTFGWEEYPTMTADRKRLVLGVHSFDQFVFLIAEDEPMTTASLDHFGMAVDSQEQFDEMLRRVRAKAEDDPRVEIKGPDVEDHGALKLHGFYTRFLLPMWVEVQYFEFE